MGRSSSVRMGSDGQICCGPLEWGYFSWASCKDGLHTELNSGPHTSHQLDWKQKGQYLHWFWVCLYYSPRLQYNIQGRRITHCKRKGQQKQRRNCNAPWCNLEAHQSGNHPLPWTLKGQRSHFLRKKIKQMKLKSSCQRRILGQKYCQPSSLSQATQPKLAD